MPEQLDLTTPIVTPTRTAYHIIRLVLDWEVKSIRVDLRGSDGIELSADYAGPQAETLMTIMNTANLSTNSLHKRILQRLVTDGKIAPGVISGTPE